MTRAPARGRSWDEVVLENPSFGDLAPAHTQPSHPTNRTDLTSEPASTRVTITYSMFVHQGKQAASVHLQNSFVAVGMCPRLPTLRNPEFLSHGPAHTDAAFANPKNRADAYLQNRSP